MATTTLQRLLRYPHAAVFDKDPGGEVAFLIGHQDIWSLDFHPKPWGPENEPSGAIDWAVADRKLRLVAGDYSREYELADYTVETLAAALAEDGFSVSNLSPVHRHLSALALVEGSGSDAQSNGNRLYVYTNLLWVILSAYAAEVAHASEQVIQALRQMVITTAEGEWLDLWGALYAVPRLRGETDADYAARIPREAFRIRVNARAIELAIRDATGWDVRIEEPWQEIFTLDESDLSGPDKLYGGEYIGYHLIRPVAMETVDWPAVLAIINRNRAAGVLISGTVGYHGRHLVFGDPYVHFGITKHYHGAAVYEDRALLDYMAIEDTSVPNHPAFRRITNLRRSGSRIDHEWYGYDTSAGVMEDYDPSEGLLPFFETTPVPLAEWAPHYVAHGRHWRDYRHYSFSVVYRSNFWTNVGPATWGSYPGGWDSAPVVHSGHSQSS